VSFKVHSEFIPARGRDAQRVALRLDGLRRSEAFASASPPAPPPATAPAAPSPPPPTQAPASPAPAAASPAPPVATPPPAPAPAGQAPPPVEVVSAPPPPEPVETGSSAVRDVVLAESGVSDLARGRRPVVPPFARMTGTRGTVEVDFSVGASGITAVQSVKGPDLLKPAAEQTAASWIFRRTKVERLYQVAVFNYDGDKPR
jgi:hypothetical protein